MPSSASAVDPISRHRPATPTLRPLAAVPAPREAEPLRDGATVAVLAGDPASRQTVLRLLVGMTGVRVVATPAGADVVVVAVERIGDTAIRTVRSIRSGGASQVVVVAAEVDRQRWAAAVRAGAAAVVGRGELTGADLRRAIVSAASPDAVIVPTTRMTVVRQAAELNARELQVLRLLADGSDTREIGRHLRYSERTVKTIISEITRRFSLRNRSHAVAYAIRSGLI